MKKTVFSALVMVLACSCGKGIGNESGSAFGWATCETQEGGYYEVIGGGNGRKVVLKSNGKDMRPEIERAIKENDVVVFDGSEGPFMMSGAIKLEDVIGKSLLGVNGARLQTEFSVTEEIKAMLESAGIGDRSPHRSGGVLPNGRKVAEEKEYNIRLKMIEYMDDENESYRSSGFFSLHGCENIIIRNISFEGPGSIDVGGADLLNFSNGTNHVWVDHCSFMDGMDGNFDINSRSDFITVSWCRFGYTERSYDHMASCLIGSNEDPSQGEDNFNITYAYCLWDKGCQVRMPVVRFGKVHVYNNWYDCAGNYAPAIDACIGAEVLVENCYFDEGVENIFRARNGALAWQLRGNIYVEDFEPSGSGQVAMPYEYSLLPAGEVPVALGGECGAGATLSEI